MDDTKTHVIHEYDPVARREYYLKNRQLKGHVPQPLMKTVTSLPESANNTTSDRQRRQEERRRKLQGEVDALKVRLQKLRVALAELTKAAKARSGVNTSAKKAPVKQKGSKPDAKLTAKQKADAAARSKANYEKNKDQILADEVKSLTEKIKIIQERIAKMRTTSSAGATKIHNKK